MDTGAGLMPPAPEGAEDLDTFLVRSSIGTSRGHHVVSIGRTCLNFV
jgi:hypothetical protein